jgi:hypothetical protein
MVSPSVEGRGDGACEPSSDSAGVVSESLRLVLGKGALRPLSPAMVIRRAVARSLRSLRPLQTRADHPGPPLLRMFATRQGEWRKAIALGR